VDCRLKEIAMDKPPHFRDRLLAGERLIGTYLKTPSPIVTEVLALSDLDCLCLDAEHAPFDRIAIDGCIAMARAAAMPALVRVPDVSHVLNALDCGATGVVAPHICTAEQAINYARACRYGENGRGYAGSSRAAGYTTCSIAANLAKAAAQTTVIAQIEDPAAVDHVDAIAAVEGIDALFVGRVDLTVAYGATSQDDPRVIAAVEKICAAGLRHNRRIGMFLARASDVEFWADRGANLFLLGSDHSFMLEGAARLVAQCR
jgi:2-keto-3-deoxy-L-rhamnonate aldolase RhmA